MFNFNLKDYNSVSYHCIKHSFMNLFLVLLGNGLGTRQVQKQQSVGIHMIGHVVHFIKRQGIFYDDLGKQSPGAK
jgi:hypothetical protein